MRRGIAILGILGVGLSLAACGNSDDNSAGSAPTGSAAATTEAAGGSGLVVWADDTRTPVITEIAKKFTADTGVQVQVVQRDYGKMRDDFTSQVPTGQGPDIIIGGGDWTGKFVQNGVIAPVELGDKASDFSKVAVDGVTYQGKVYGLPYAIENVAMIRNTDLAPTAPATMDEAIAQGQQLITDGKAKYPFLIQMDPTEGDAYHMYPVQTSFGAPVFGTNADGTYNPDDLAMAGDGGHQFATYLAKIGGEGVVGPTLTSDVTKEAFLKGEAPFIITGPWNTGDFTKAGIKFSVDKVPAAGAQASQPFVGVQAFFISAKSANQLAANQFVVNYLGTKDAQLSLFQAGGRPPALTAAAEDSSVTSDPVIAGFAAVGVDGVAMPNIPAMDAVWSDWGTTQVAIATGKGDPIQLWDAMTQSIKDKIAAAK